MMKRSKDKHDDIDEVSEEQNVFEFNAYLSLDQEENFEELVGTLQHLQE